MDLRREILHMRCWRRHEGGLLRHDAGDRYVVFSPGVDSAVGISLEAGAVMREIRIDLSGHRPKNVKEFGGQPFDFVLTVCDNARETCPLFPGQIHENFRDPAAFHSSEDEQLTLSRKVRDQTRNYLRTFPADT
jgi:arsenate reductase (thioredoxin)